MNKLLLLRRRKEKIFCEITDVCDKHLVRESSISLIQHVGYGTYLVRDSDNTYVIRFPGATRGYIEVDTNNVIMSINLYHDLCFDNGKPNSIAVYHNSLDEKIKHFISHKFVEFQDFNSQKNSDQ